MSNAEPAVDFHSAADLPALYRLLDEVQVKNGWAKAVPVIVREPKQVFVPHRWRFADTRAALHAAGRLVGTEWAERRNLIMANPFPGNDYATVPTLVGAYQMVKAGEKAHSHRHTPNAMRVVLEAAPGTFTVVEGAKIPMAPGDVLLTPNWCWHGHSNESAMDAYWIDYLDAPLTAAIGPMFFEQHPDKVEGSNRTEERSPMRFAFGDYSRALAQADRIAPGVRQHVLGPATLESFDRVALEMSSGVQWEPGRTSANQIYTVVQGRGRSLVGQREFSWERGDMMAVPCWQPQQHQADENTILLRVSDEPLMRMLGWLRGGAA